MLQCRLVCFQALVHSADVVAALVAASVAASVALPLLVFPCVCQQSVMEVPQQYGVVRRRL